MVYQIIDISVLQNITSLVELLLSSNQVSDIAPLVANTGLGSGDEVWLANNNLDLTPGSDDMNDIQTLQSRGVMVHY